jgi:RNA-directed DNA polymerase
MGGSWRRVRRGQGHRIWAPGGNPGDERRAYRCDPLPRQLPTRLRDGNSARKFAQIDGYVHERLAIFASIKHGRHGRNYHRFTWGWFTSLGVYLLSGRVRHGAAHALR